METAGMIGGLGPESTVDYYRLIIARYRARNPDGSNPPLVINSLDLLKGIQLVDTGRLSELADYLVAGVECLGRAGAVFGFLSATSCSTKFSGDRRFLCSASCEPHHVLPRPFLVRVRDQAGQA